MKIKDERFWKKVKKQENGCWEYQGRPNARGYSQIKRCSKTLVGHRYVIQLLEGFYPSSDVHICHKCDNKICVNPDHLFKGTHQDNMDDRQRKGRTVYQTKLNSEQVLEIKKLLKLKYRQQDIADAFGVKQNTISYINTNKTWNKGTGTA